MAVGDIARCRTVCYVNNQISVNTSWWKAIAVTGGPIANSYIGFSLLFDLAMANVYKPWMSSKARYRGVGVQLWDPIINAPASTESQITTSDGPGIGTAALQATQVSGLIAWKTGLPGRHFQGRIFPGFADELFQDADGKFTAGGRTVLDGIRVIYTLPITLTSGVNTETWTLTVRSFTPAVPPANPLSVFNTVTQGITRANFATQRRRGQLGKLNVLPF